MANVEYYEQKDVLGYRGERVYCQKCRDPGEKVLWKLLYEVVTKPRARIPQDEEDKILRIIQQHIMNYPDHTISITRMRA